MATYIIGDLQGCFDPLLKLLEKIDYQPAQDQLWFAGDIINRGPQSLECIRFVKQTIEAGRGQMVLGNHDFHLLATYAGFTRFHSKSDTLLQVLEAPDCDELVNWLRHQPLLVSHDLLHLVMIHAGIPPQWSIKAAQSHAKEVEAELRNENWQHFVKNELWGSEPRQWSEQLTGYDRLRYIVNAFVRMRYCDAKGTLDFELKSSPDNEAAQNSPYRPWFVFPNRKNRDYEIFFGHWSTLGAIDAYHIHATDTGCLWGGKLTAYCVETQKRHTVKCEAYKKVRPLHG